MFKKFIPLASVFSFLLLISACSDAVDPAPVTAVAATPSAADTARAAVTASDTAERFIRIAPPVRTADPKKIEVTEVFWYGCSHCFNFDPMLEAWAKQLPADVVFRRSPAMWNEPMVVHAQAFYTAEALGVIDQLHGPLFSALNTERNPLRDSAAVEKLFLAHSDVDAEAFRKTFNSFGVNSQVKQAESRAKAYGIAGTPELIVNGKYRITARLAGGQAEMLEVAQELIAKERAGE